MFSVSLVIWGGIQIMQELSIKEMTSLRGGSNYAWVFSAGNVAIALPINIEVLSNNSGSGGTPGSGNVFQTAEAIAGTQSVKLLGWQKHK